MPTVSRTASPSRRRLQYLPAAQLHSSARPKIPVRQAARAFIGILCLAAVFDWIKKDFKL